MKTTFLPTAAAVAVTAVILLFTGSCFLRHCQEGNGHVITEERSAGASFSEISLAGDFTVYVIPGNTESITVEAESNLMEYVVTEVRGNELVLRTPGMTCLQPEQPIVITVRTKNKINGLTLSGSGYFEADSLVTDHLKLTLSGSGDFLVPVYADVLEATISGSGDIEVYGKVQSTDLTISGSGDIKAYGLDQDYCRASISGSGNMYLLARKELEVYISGSGSVYYKGNPLVEAHISGSGGLYPR